MAHRTIDSMFCDQQRAGVRRRGASALTYGLVVGLIAVGAISTVDSVGNSVTDLFEAVDTNLDGVANDSIGGDDDTAPPPPVNTPPTFTLAPQGALP